MVRGWEEGHAPALRRDAINIKFEEVLIRDDRLW
jgi:hypothetical protein